MWIFGYEGFDQDLLLYNKKWGSFYISGRLKVYLIISSPILLTDSSFDITYQIKMFL